MRLPQNACARFACLIILFGTDARLFVEDGLPTPIVQPWVCTVVLTQRARRNIPRCFRHNLLDKGRGSNIYISTTWYVTVKLL